MGTIIASSDQRHAPRYGAICDIEVDAGDVVYPAVLMDLSSSGFRAMVDGTIPTNTTVRLRIGVYPAWSANVIRQHGTIIGCLFCESLPRARFLAILRRHIPSSWNDPTVYRGDAASPDYGHLDDDARR